MSACRVLEESQTAEIVDLRPQLKQAKREFIVADLFCGAGGLTEAFRRAAEARGLAWTGVCVNHWDKAIESHSLNHPHMRHVCSGVELTDPRTLVPGGYLDLLIAGVSCTHHSNARGGTPVNDQLRSGGWQVVRWCQVLDIRELMIENVREFQDWGPVKDGAADKKRKGEYFRLFVRKLEALGYWVEWRVVNCADYGDPQTRRRLIIRARKGGRPWWPEPTHIDPKVAAKDRLGIFEGRKAWRTAREDVIDWSLRGRSIFDPRYKPLAAKTLQRIYLGFARYGGPNAPIFLAVLGEYMRGRDIAIPRVKARKGETLSTVIVTLRSNDPSRSVNEPITTVTASGTHHMLAEMICEPTVIRYNSGEKWDRSQSVDAPIGTLDTSNRFAVIEVVASRDGVIVGAGGSEYAGKPKSVADPIATVTANDHKALAQGVLINTDHRGGNGEQTVDLDGPMSTVCSKARNILAQPVLMSHRRPKETDCDSVDAPIKTVTASSSDFMLAEASADACLINFKGKSTATSLDSPTPTQTTMQHQYLAEPMVMPHRVFQMDDCDPIDTPIRTVRAESGRQNGLITTECETLVTHFNERDGQDPRCQSVDAPSPTVTSRGAGQIAQGFLVDTNHGSKPGDSEDRRAQPISEPIQTVTGSRGKAIITPFTIVYNGTGTAGSVDAPIGTVTTHDRFAVLWVGEESFGLDIHIRMLKPHELLKAMGLGGYRVVGNQGQQVKQIGNAVPGNTGEAHMGCVLDHWDGWEELEVAA